MALTALIRAIVAGVSRHSGFDGSHCISWMCGRDSVRQKNNNNVLRVSCTRSVSEGMQDVNPSSVELQDLASLLCANDTTGDILDFALSRLNKFARVVLCGAISQYSGCYIERKLKLRLTTSHRRNQTAWIARLPGTYFSAGQNRRIRCVSPRQILSCQLIELFKF